MNPKHQGLEVDVEKQLKDFAQRTGQSLNRATRGATLKLFSSIITMTPVDTGEAAGGWVMSYDAPAAGPTGRKGVGAALASLSTFQNGDFARTVYLSNSVKHVVGLEYGTHPYGFSPKAPAGMVRVNVQRFPRMLQEMVQKEKNS
jgi:hypothetical protein